jgi:dTMP kinase
MPGFFFSFEGPDGAGKTTLIQRLEAALIAAGRAPLRTREPGGDAVGERVRALLLDVSMTGEAEFLLFAAARAQNVAAVVRPALAAGRIVLCDRFTDSSLAYQGYGRGLPLELIARVNAFATGDLVPERTYLIDVPAAIGLARRGTDGETNRLDREALAFHERVGAGYRALAADAPARFAVIDGMRSPDAVFAAVWDDLWARVGA